MIRSCAWCDRQLGYIACPCACPWAITTTICADHREPIPSWSGSRLAQARSLARHSTRRLAGLLGVAHSTVQRQERRERLTPYMQRRITAAPRVHSYYRGLTEGETT